MGAIQVSASDGVLRLGIASSALPALYREAKEALGLGNTPKASALQPEERDVCTRVLLCCVGESYSAWNMRKALVVDGLVDADSDLSFSRRILLMQPKSTWTWAHRRWLLERTSRRASAANLERMALSEIALSAEVSQRYPRLYYAWQHRCWASELLPSPALRQQVEELRKHVHAKPSDHSAFSCLAQLCDLQCEREGRLALQWDARVRYWDRELLLNFSAIEAQPGHEALWGFRRFLFTRWLGVLEECVRRKRGPASPGEELGRALLSCDLEPEHVRFELRLAAQRSPREAEQHFSSNPWDLESVLESAFRESSLGLDVGENITQNDVATWGARAMATQRHFALSYTGWAATATKDLLGVLSSHRGPSTRSFGRRLSATFARDGDVHAYALSAVGMLAWEARERMAQFRQDMGAALPTGDPVRASFFEDDEEGDT